MRSGPFASTRVRLPGILLFIATAGLLGLIGFWRMFSHFPDYDDEGYILHSVRSYLEQGGLYHTVYSQYGPAFYVLLEAVQRVTGLAVDQAFARWFTLGLWFATALVLGVVTARGSRSRSLGWFTWVATFLYLHQFSEEAFHPGVVICFLLAGTIGVMLELLRRDLTGWAAFVAGTGAAGLGLLKINVGVLFAAGCGLWFVFTRGRRWLGCGSGLWGAAAGVLVAGALMHGLLEAGWVWVFIVVLAAGLAGLGATIPPRRGFGRGEAVAFALGAALVLGLVVTLIMRRGTPGPALLEGVLLAPLRHADAYAYAVDWRPGTLGLALAGLLALGIHQWLSQHGRSEAAERLLVGLRLAHILGVLAVVVLLGHFRVIGILFSYSIPWLWLWVRPLPSVRRSDPGDDARELMACVLILQTLHAYPVGGIQICWGSFLLFALLAMAVPETVVWLGSRLGPPRRAGIWLGALLLVATGGKAVFTAWEYGRTYAARPDLGLPGTAGLRLNERETATYQVMVTNSVAHGDMLFSLPGRLSFNLWSDLPTPTAKNTTLWYALLGEPDQTAIIQALERAARPVLVVDRASLAVLHASGAPPKGPLYTYLLANFRPAFWLRDLGFWVKAGRPVAPIGILRRESATRLQVGLIGGGEPIEVIELRNPDEAAGVSVVLDARNAQVMLQPIHPDGSPRAAPREAAWPLQFDGLAWLTIESPLIRAHPAERPLLAVIRSGDGRSSQAALSAGPR